MLQIVNKSRTHQIIAFLFAVAALGISGYLISTLGVDNTNDLDKLSPLEQRYIEETTILYERTGH